MIPEKENENFNASSTIKQITTIAGAVLALNAIALVGHGCAQAMADFKARWTSATYVGAVHHLVWRGRNPIVG